MGWRQRQSPFKEQKVTVKINQNRDLISGGIETLRKVSVRCRCFCSTAFEHAAAQAYFGASIFWIRRLAALNGEQATIEYWQIKRDGSQRGIVEIISE